MRGSLTMGGHLGLGLQDVGQAAVLQATAEVGVGAVSGIRDRNNLQDSGHEAVSEAA
ncbi:hypothetical protein ACGF4C_20040 [Streptomyces sp. NPDC048197]|uniref:hypothetical protein n=1 Tax=Streptomyces sp. NPDC048197 TaxID=3365511 RepID=UPI003720A6A3